MDTTEDVITALKKDYILLSKHGCAALAGTFIATILVILGVNKKTAGDRAGDWLASEAGRVQAEAAITTAVTQFEKKQPERLAEVEKELIEIRKVLSTAVTLDKPFGIRNQRRGYLSYEVSTSAQPVPSLGTAPKFLCEDTNVSEMIWYITLPDQE